jgi:hypothetical protein
MPQLNCIIRMVGGLGNQLFQYALGRSLESELGARVRFDVSQYEKPGERRLSIMRLNTQVRTPSPLDKLLMRLSFGRTLHRCRPALRRVCPSAVWNVHEDAWGGGFDPEVRELRGRWYLLGWWQNPAYFELIRPTLLEEFKPRERLTRANVEIKRRIDRVNAVCVHVRRGDLARDPTGTAGSPWANHLQPLEYYQSSMADIRRRVRDPHFFVFSDDADWAKQHIHCDAPMDFLANNGAKRDYFDLYLMSSCRHFIIANSTFSWWGAWLSTYGQKQVIVPPKWASNGAGPPPGLIPEEWQIGSRPASAGAELPTAAQAALPSAARADKRLEVGQ